MAYCSSPFNYHRAARRSAPFFGPSPSSVQAEFAPFLRMFNELDNITSGSRQALRSFQPRFDVREEQDAYHLQGELPGVEQKDINIEFVDQTTLVVRGQAVRERQAGTPPKAAIEQQQPQQDEDAAEKASSQSDAASDAGSNYHRPSVEDTQDEDWTDAAPTPASTTTEVAAATKEAEEAPVAAQEPEQQQQKQQQPASSSHYWVSERSVGQFQRAFNFSGQIDQDAVTANLKNGILSIVVPKVQPKQPRKITVQ